MTVAGVIYGLPDRAVFISAEECKTVVMLHTRSWVSEVEGIRIGLGALPGRVVTLLSFSSDGRSHDSTSSGALLCETESGEALLLEGGRIEEVGRFSAEEKGAVRWRGALVDRLDVSTFYRGIEKQVWERSALIGPHGARIVAQAGGLGSSGAVTHRDEVKR
jgi:hypothetical protein